MSTEKSEKIAHGSLARKKQKALPQPGRAEKRFAEKRLYKTGTLRSQRFAEFF
jgi:hypothetical protein